MEQERRSAANGGGKSVTWIGVLGMIAGLMLATGLTRASRRQRASIEGMLDDSRPCAVRTRR
jgi:hypothetical protein